MSRLYSFILSGNSQHLGTDAMLLLATYSSDMVFFSSWLLCIVAVIVGNVVFVRKGMEVS
jgi:hypothetical protein